ISSKKSRTMKECNNRLITHFHFLNNGDLFIPALIRSPIFHFDWSTDLKIIGGASLFTQIKYSNLFQRQSGPRDGPSLRPFSRCSSGPYRCTQGSTVQNFR
ncbi:hypothetical protein PFISCL1PPCAC_1346, partial [Pristionchus fissidentatus]